MLRAVVVIFITEKPSVTMKSEVLWKTGILVTDDKDVETIVSRHGTYPVNKVYNYHKRAEEGCFWVED